MKPPGNPDASRDEELELLIYESIDLLLSTLPMKQARIVRAIDLEGALPQSVADDHGLSLNEVTRQLALGRQSLTDRFGEMLMICPQHGLAVCDCHSKGSADA